MTWNGYSSCSTMVYLPDFWIGVKAIFAHCTSLFETIGSRLTLVYGCFIRGLNERTLGIVSVPTSDHVSLSPYSLPSGSSSIERTVQARIPVAIRPSHSTPRIQAQQGVFTIHGHRKHGLNKQYEKFNSLGLVKFIIEGRRKRSILLELHRGGINEERFFPGLQGLCSDITFRYSISYMRASGPPKVAKRPVVPIDRSAHWRSDGPRRYSYSLGEVKRKR